MTLGMLLLALVLALDIFAGAIALGLRGLPVHQWARTAALFAVAAFLMLAAGVLLGRLLGEQLGSHATYFAGVLLLIVGIRAVLEATQGHDAGDPAHEPDFTWRALIGLSLVICMDKFAAGLSLAGIDESLTGFMAYLMAQTFLVTFCGFWVGVKVGVKVGAAAEIIAGAIFIILGALIIYQTWNGSKLIV